MSNEALVQKVALAVGDYVNGHTTYRSIYDAIRATLSAPEAEVVAWTADEFSTEGVKRVADRMRRDGQPSLASALMDLAEQRDTLRAQLAEREREVFQWQANSRENKLIAEGCSRREQEAEQKLAASEARVGELEKAGVDAEKIMALAGEMYCVLTDGGGAERAGEIVLEIESLLAPHVAAPVVSAERVAELEHFLARFDNFDPICGTFNFAPTVEEIHAMAESCRAAIAKQGEGHD